MGGIAGCEYRPKANGTASEHSPSEHSPSSAKAKCSDPACRLELSWKEIAALGRQGKVRQGGNGQSKKALVAGKDYQIWACIRDWDVVAQQKCSVRHGEFACWGQNPSGKCWHGEFACFFHDDNQGTWDYQGPNSEERLINAQSILKSEAKEMVHLEGRTLRSISGLLVPPPVVNASQ